MRERQRRHAGDAWDTPRADGAAASGAPRDGDLSAASGAVAAWISAAAPSCRDVGPARSTACPGVKRSPGRRAVPAAEGLCAARAFGGA